MYAGILFAELIVLFLTSRIVSKSLFSLFHRLSHSYAFAIHALAAVFLPGVIVHELAHFLIAELLQVPTGEIEFMPVVSGQDVKLGSVQIARTDFVRRFFIGIAPIVVGSLVLLVLLWFAGLGLSLSAIPTSPLLAVKYLAILYGLFVVSNTMFSSKKDLEGAIEFLGVLLFVLLVVVFAFPHAVFSWLNFLLLTNVSDVLQQISLLLLIPVTINVFFTVIMRRVVKY